MAANRNRRQTEEQAQREKTDPRPFLVIPASRSIPRVISEPRFVWTGRRGMSEVRIPYYAPYPVS